MFGGCLKDVWKMFGGCLVDVWRMFGGYLVDVWRMFGECLEDVWRRFGKDRMRTFEQDIMSALIRKAFGQDNILSGKQRDVSMEQLKDIWSGE